jgi:hypothetical protein
MSMRSAAPFMLEPAVQQQEFLLPLVGLIRVPAGAKQSGSHESSRAGGGAASPIHH